MFFLNSIKKIFIFIQNHFLSLSQINSVKKEKITIILNEDSLKIFEYLDSYVNKQSFNCTDILWLTSYAFEYRVLQNSYHKNKINIIYIKNLTNLNKILDVLNKFHKKTEIIIINQISRINFSNEIDFYYAIKSISDFYHKQNTSLLFIDQEELLNEKKVKFIYSMLK